MLEDSSSKVLISKQLIYNNLVGSSSSIAHYVDLSRCNILIIDDDLTAAALNSLSGERILDTENSRPLSPYNPAYIIYTSGTTGKP